MPPWSEIELLNFEKDTLGLFFTGHPMDRWAGDLREYGAKTIADLGLRKEKEPEVDLEDGDVRHSQADLTRAAALLGYRPTLDFAEGLARTAAEDATHG